MKLKHKCKAFDVTLEISENLLRFNCYTVFINELQNTPN